MTDLGTMLQGLVGEQPARQALRLATTVSFDYSSQTAQVLMPDGSTLTVATANQIPLVGIPIWVLIVGEVAISLGRPVRPPMGTVAAAAVAGLVNVTGDDGKTYPVGFPTTYTPAVGHRVLLYWEGGGHIIARMDVSNPAPPPPDQPTPVVRKTQTFNPIDSGSYRGGWGGQNIVYFGQSYPSAGWFYGTQIGDSIPDTASITGMRVYLEVTAASGLATMPLGLHTSPTKGGSLAIDNVIDIGSMPNGFRGDVGLPTSWGDLLKTGARWGIGTYGAGYRRLNGAPVSGAITISWEE